LLFVLTLVKFPNMGVSYPKIFDEALSDLGELLRRRRQIDAEVSQLRDIILALYEKAGASKARKEKLMAIFGELDIGTPRLTEGVKDALYAAHPRKLPAIQVKDVMEARGFDFSNFANPLASVHSTLRRLAGQGEVGSGPEKGMVAYWWKGPHWGARTSLANILAERELSMKVSEKIRDRVNQNLARHGIHLRGN
jgi:hypothetical protein